MAERGDGEKGVGVAKHGVEGVMYVGGEDVGYCVQAVGGSGGKVASDSWVASGLSDANGDVQEDHEGDCESEVHVEGGVETYINGFKVETTKDILQLGNRFRAF